METEAAARAHDLAPFLSVCFAVNFVASVWDRSITGLKEKARSELEADNTGLGKLNEDLEFNFEAIEELLAATAQSARFVAGIFTIFSVVLIWPSACCPKKA